MGCGHHDGDSVNNDLHLDRCRVDRCYSPLVAIIAVLFAVAIFTCVVIGALAFGGLFAGAARSLTGKRP